MGLTDTDTRWTGKWFMTTPAWYYNVSGGAVDNSHYMGIDTYKNPLDAWAYQEIIWEHRPDVIIETGTLFGGSALMMYHWMVNAGIEQPLVITCDIQDEFHRGVTADGIVKVKMNTSNPEIVPTIEAILVANPVNAPKIMMVLDSDHRREHVVAELNLLSRFVTKGQYLIVEDGDAVPGPWEAVNDWLPSAPDFVRTARFEDKFVWTSNPGGWLMRVEGPDRLHVPLSVSP